MNVMSMKEKRELIEKLRPIDDVFFEVLANDKKVCQEILRVILKDDKLTVEEVITQDSEKNIYGRSVRLDALCILGNGTKCNIEVQRSDNDDHQRRVRFNASSVTLKDSNPGDKFKDVIELYVVYISEFDVFEEGLCVYHVERIIQETGNVVDNGLHEIYVNTENNDGSDIAELMACFKETRVNNQKFPEIARRINEIKDVEGGLGIMCKTMEQYMEKYMAESKAEGRTEGMINTLVSLVKQGLLSSDDAAKNANISKEEFLKLLSASK